MKRTMLMGLVLALAGCGASEPSNRCGTSEPSNKEVAQGMIQSFVRETGIPSSNLKAKAKKIGNGRWAVSMEAERHNGERRTLNATAVMDKNGDIHYYTD